MTKLPLATRLDLLTTLMGFETTQFDEFVGAQAAIYYKVKRLKLKPKQWLKNPKNAKSELKAVKAWLNQVN